MNIGKKIISILLCVILMCSGMTIASFAADEMMSGNFTYTVSSGKVTIVGYPETGKGSVIVPSTIDGKTVVAIDDGAFQACTLITEVIIPDTVTSIGKYAFAYCVTLETVTIPSSVTFIGKNAFQNSKKVIIACESGSYAETYANENGITTAEGDSSSSDDTETVVTGTYEDYGIGVVLNDDTAPTFVGGVTVDGVYYNVSRSYDLSFAEAEAYKGKKVDITIKNDEVIKMVISKKGTFIDEHISVYNKMYDSWEYNGFYVSSDQEAIKKNKNLSRIWDSIKDVGEVASLSFDKLQITADYYETYLSDMVIAFANSTESDDIKAEAFDFYSKGLGLIEACLESTDEKLEIDGIIAKTAFSADYDISDEMKNALSKSIKNAKENNPTKFKKIFNGLDCADEICNGISTGVDAFNSFKDCYQAYCTAQATKKMCVEFFDVCKDAIKEINKTNSKFASWLKESVDEFEKDSMSDSTFYKTAKEALVKYGYGAYDLFVKDSLTKVIYNGVAKCLGVLPGQIVAIVAAYNFGCTLADLIAPTDSESAYYLFYVSPVESALQTVVKTYANTMKSNENYTSAQKYDIAFKTLKYTNIALYSKAYDYAAAHRFLWIKSRSWKNSMEVATHYKDLWQNYKCHEIDYSSFDNIKTVGVKCPVDVYLYNGKGEQVIAIENDEITKYIDDRIAIDIYNGQKSISYPSDGDYFIKIIARESGKMEYVVLSEQDKMFRSLEFYDIDLSTGQEFNGKIPLEHSAESKEYCLKTMDYTIAPDFDSSIAMVDSISVLDVSINYKQSKTLEPEVVVADGTDYTVTYSSDSKNVTVDENGKIYGAKKGTANITVTVTDTNGNVVTDTCKVTVEYAWWQWLIKIVLFGWIWY